MAMFRNAAGAAMALLVVLAMLLEAHAQCPSVTSFAACRTAVTTKNAQPTMACCNKVKSVLAITDGAGCLCNAMTSTVAQNLKVIKSEAVLLPSKCQRLMGLQYIKNYNCKGSTVP